jgi:hypothetical protein
LSPRLDPCLFIGFRDLCAVPLKIGSSDGSAVIGELRRRLPRLDFADNETGRVAADHDDGAPGFNHLPFGTRVDSLSSNFDKTAR